MFNDYRQSFVFFSSSFALSATTSPVSLSLTNHLRDRRCFFLGKDAYNQAADYPPYDPMPAGPPPYGQYPHPPGPPPPAIHVQPTAVYQTSIGTTVFPGAVIIQQNVGPHPTRTTCRSCNQEMVTRIDRRPTMRTHLMAALLCILGWVMI